MVHRCSKCQCCVPCEHPCCNKDTQKVVCKSLVPGCDCVLSLGSNVLKWVNGYFCGTVQAKDVKATNVTATNVNATNVNATNLMVTNIIMPVNAPLTLTWTFSVGGGTPFTLTSTLNYTIVGNVVTLFVGNIIDAPPTNNLGGGLDIVGFAQIPSVITPPIKSNSTQIKLLDAYSLSVSGSAETASASGTATASPAVGSTPPSISIDDQVSSKIYELLGASFNRVDILAFALSYLTAI